MFTSRTRRTISRNAANSRLRRPGLSLLALERREMPAVITVNTTNDVVNAADMVVSLREAIESVNAGKDTSDVVANVVANNYGTDDEIRFDAVVFGAGKTITLAKGELAIANDLLISGPNAILTVDANAKSRAFSIGSAVANPVVEFHNLRVINGLALNDFGGAIRVNDGALSVFNCEVANSKAMCGGGIAVLDEAILLMGNTTVRNNEAKNSAGLNLPGLGGGLYVEGGALLLASTIWQNSAESGGGGICNMGSPLFGMANCTLSSNSALGGVPEPSPHPLTDGMGGAILGVLVPGPEPNPLPFPEPDPIPLPGPYPYPYPEYPNPNPAPDDTSFLVANCTITNNFAQESGGGIAWLQSGGYDLEGSIVAQNGAATNVKTHDLWCDVKTDVYGSKNLVGLNETVDTNAQIGAGNQVGVWGAGGNGIINAKLGVIAANGGPTLTHAVLAGSPAIDKGSNAIALQFDQRGGPLFNRSVGIVNPMNPIPDCGAYELQKLPPMPPRMGGCALNNGAAQRSMVTSLTVDFDQQVSLPANPADAFEIRRQSDNAVVQLVANVSTDTATHVTLTFAGSTVIGGSLADGRYTLTIFGSKVSGASGRFDGNGDGLGGDDYVEVGSPTSGHKLFRLFGDADGNGIVSTIDFIAFRSQFGGSSPTFDYDGSGSVGTLDFSMFRFHFGTSI